MIELLSQYKEEIVKFMSGSAFIGACAMFLIWLVFWKLLRGIWNFLVGIVVGFLSLFNPMRFRRVAINTLSLIFMTVSFALYAGANAKLHDRGAALEAILGGSLAVAIWSVIMFVVNLIRGDTKPKKPKRRRDPKFQGTSGKVIPPSNME
jgi:hypothetical protein